MKSNDLATIRSFWKRLSDRLHAINYLNNIPFVTFIERDLANSVQITMDSIQNQNLAGFYFFCEDAKLDRQAGVFKRGKSGHGDRSYASRTNLYIEEDRIKFDPNLFTLTLDCEQTPHTKTDENKQLGNSDANNAIDYLLFQLLRFGWDPKKQMHHGKGMDRTKENAENDDAAVVLQMLCYWLYAINDKGSGKPYKDQINMYCQSFNCAHYKEAAAPSRLVPFFH